MTINDIGTNNKFRLLGGPLNMFESTDIYEKLDERLYKNSRSTPTNAYNLTRQEYTFIDANHPVIPSLTSTRRKHMSSFKIASFRCHGSESSCYTMTKIDDEYVFQKTWFNEHCPSDRSVENVISKNAERIAEHFLGCAKLTLDTTKDYNRDVTDEQRLKIRDAMNDVHEYFEYLELEVNP